MKSLKVDFSKIIKRSPSQRIDKIISLRLKLKIGIALVNNQEQFMGHLYVSGTYLMNTAEQTPKKKRFSSFLPISIDLPEDVERQSLLIQLDSFQYKLISPYDIEVTGMIVVKKMNKLLQKTTTETEDDVELKIASIPTEPDDTALDVSPTTKVDNTISEDILVDSDNSDDSDGSDDKELAKELEIISTAKMVCPSVNDVVAVYDNEIAQESDKESDIMVVAAEDTSVDTKLEVAELTTISSIKESLICDNEVFSRDLLIENERSQDSEDPDREPQAQAVVVSLNGFKANNSEEGYVWTDNMMKTKEDNFTSVKMIIEPIK